ncbi:MAG: hypothetical protein QOE45_1795 [Frankiaceae bacterium]|nr:hypothetical protein [Frankiaceae bacterium]
MNISIKRAFVLGTAAIGLTVGGFGAGAARADYHGCNDDVLVSVAGEQIRLGVAPELGQPGRPVWLWVCTDEGSVAGANSVGTAGYVTRNGDPAYLEHIVVCPDYEGCSQYFVGAALHPPQAGAYGVRPCVSPVTAEDALCVSVGVTPGSVPVTPSVQTSCQINVAGTCAYPDVTVRTGGTALTVYVGGSPTDVNVPVWCIRTYPILTVIPGSGC